MLPSSLLLFFIFFRTTRQNDGNEEEKDHDVETFVARKTQWVKFASVGFTSFSILGVCLRPCVLACLRVRECFLRPNKGHSRLDCTNANSPNGTPSHPQLEANRNVPPPPLPIHNFSIFFIMILYYGRSRYSVLFSLEYCLLTVGIHFFSYLDKA